MSLFPKKINGASCPVARARGAIYGHMKSGRPDEQSTWAHFRQFCHWIKIHQAHFQQKFHSTLQWGVQEKSLHHKNQEIIQAQLMFKGIYYKNV